MVTHQAGRLPALRTWTALAALAAAPAFSQVSQPVDSEVPSAPDPALEVTLFGDTDRDGSLTEADLRGRHRASLTHGALVLNNCDSDQDTGDPDHADDRINGPADFRDLSYLELRAVSTQPGAVSIAFEVPEPARAQVRLFGPVAEEKTDVQTVPLDGSEAYSLDGPVSRGAFRFGMEAKSFADADWNGVVEVKVTLRHEDGLEVTDTVALRVAPWIMLSSLDGPQTLYVREFAERNDELISQLKTIVPAANTELHIVPASAPYDAWNIWLQDTMEIGYTQHRPDVRMSVVLPSNRNKSLDRFPREQLLGPDFGWFSKGTYRPQYGAGDGEGDASWIDWYGNLEATPPIPGYPFGRVYYGVADNGASLNPEVVAMIDAQAIQGPALPIDVTFLLIKHVDELISFLPTGDPERPFVAMVPNVREMLKIMRRLDTDADKDAPLLSTYKEEMTVASFLADEELIAYNEDVQAKYLDPLVEKIQSEFGVAPRDIVRVPAFYEKDGRSMVPNMVNSVILGDMVIVPAPEGPVVDGRDVLEADLRARLKDLPVKVFFVNDEQYHKWCGNVHCATNVRRHAAADEWWTALTEE
ncbi:MAG: protein-arginine deiminase family protein [Sumerlaeia bacterium]